MAPNANSATITRVSSSTPASKNFSAVHARGGVNTHKRISGVTTSAPVMSPSHHVAHTGRNSDHVA